MALDEGDGVCDFLAIPVDDQLCSKLEKILYAGDRTVCYVSDSSLHMFLSARLEAKEYLMSYRSEMVTDLHELLKTDKCVFFRGMDNAYIRIRNDTSLITLFDLTKHRFIRRGEFGERTTEASMEHIQTKIPYHCNHNTLTDTTYEIDKTFFKFLNKERNNKSINRDVSLKKIVPRRSDSIFAISIPFNRIRYEANTVSRNQFDNHVTHTRDQRRPTSGLIHGQPTTDVEGRPPYLKQTHYSTTADATKSPFKRENTRHSLQTLFERDGYVSKSRQEDAAHNQQPVARPAGHPDYIDSSRRLESFSTWKFTSIQDPIHLANKGFFYTGRQDLVRCFQCGIGLKDFSETDDPLAEHIKYSGSCEFLVELLGEEELRRRKSRLEQTDPEYYRRQQWQELQNRSEKTNAHPPQAVYRHPRLSTLVARLDTYTGWPSNCPRTPRELAEAGFFFTGSGDVVRCWACDGGLQKWDPADDPWLEHCRWFPACSYAQQEKGESYIRLVQHALETGDESQLLAAASKSRPEEAIATATSALSLTDSAKVDDISTPLVEQLIGMGYARDVTHAAVQSFKQKHKGAPDIMSLIDEIEAMRRSGNTYQKEPSVDSLRRENERLRNMALCIKCKSANREALFLPCKHLWMCMTCSENVSRCPVCNKDIIHKIKTFIP